jgi:serine/threonine protein kinase
VLFGGMIVLKEMHSKGMMHRNVKTTNILMSADGKIKMGISFSLTFFFC